MLQDLCAISADLTIVEATDSPSIAIVPSPPPASVDSPQGHSSAERQTATPTRATKAKAAVPHRKKANSSRRRPSALEQDNVALRVRLEQLVRIQDKITQAEARLRGITTRWEKIRADRDIELTCAVCLNVIMHPCLANHPGFAQLCARGQLINITLLDLILITLLIVTLFDHVLFIYMPGGRSILMDQLCFLALSFVVSAFSRGSRNHGMLLTLSPFKACTVLAMDLGVILSSTILDDA
ncbi:hypothetical protein OF83DRAFT_1168262 [Amylostereum chailletii]|nr:hypothetical protein OF83DRAFT_1168262 [Amylostereum chailletii]